MLDTHFLRNSETVTQGVSFQVKDDCCSPIEDCQLSMGEDWRRLH